MAFAQPLALFFLLLFIPIVLLYLLKQRRRRVQVSTLLFWDQILRDEHSVTSITKLRKLLSLLLQLLIVGLLTLALARPVFSKDLLGGRRVIVFLDHSASMSAQEASGARFDEAKRRAAQILGNMSLGDAGMLVSVGAHPDILVPLTDSRKELLDALGPLPLSHQETNFAAALALLTHLPPDQRPTHAYLVTDGAFPPIAFTPPENTLFGYEAVGEARENVGVTAFQLRPLPTSPRDFEIMFEAANYTDEEQTVPFELRIAGRMVDAGELRVPAQGHKLHTLLQFSQLGGEVEVVLDFEDPFPLDNRACAVLPQPQPFHVLLITEGNLFLESALLTDEEIELEVVRPSEYAASLQSLAHPQQDYVFVFDGWAPEAAPAVNAVYVARWPASLGLEVLGEAEAPLIVEWDREHPINRHLHLTNIALQQAVRVQPAAGWHALIQGIQEPLALYREQDGASTLVLAFDTRSSDLPLRVAFPILVANAIRHMAGAGEEVPWQGPAMGTLLTRAELAPWLRMEGAAEEPFLVLGPEEPAPEKELLAAQLEKAPAQGLIAVARSGIYRRVTGNGVTAPLFAANLNSRAESNIRPADTLPITSEKPLQLVEERVRFSAEPWLLFALLGLCLLGAEWFFFHRRWVE